MPQVDLALLFDALLKSVTFFYNDNKFCQNANNANIFVSLSKRGKTFSTFLQTNFQLYSSRMVQTWQAFVARGLRALRAWTGDLIIYLGQPLYEDSVKCPRCNLWIQSKNKARHQQSMVCHDGQIQQAVNWAMGAPQLNNQ